jgi:hypothetical protein
VGIWAFGKVSVSLDRPTEMLDRVELQWQYVQPVPPSQTLADHEGCMEGNQSLFESLEEARRCSHSSVASAFGEHPMAQTCQAGLSVVTGRPNVRSRSGATLSGTYPLVCFESGEVRPPCVDAVATGPPDPRQAVDQNPVRWPDAVSAGTSSGFSVPSVSASVVLINRSSDVEEERPVPSGNCNTYRCNPSERFPPAAEGCYERGPEFPYPTERREDAVDRLPPRIVRPRPIKPSVPPSLVVIVNGKNAPHAPHPRGSAPPGRSRCLVPL